MFRITLRAFEGLSFFKNCLPSGKLCDWAWNWKCSESSSHSLLWVMIFQIFLPSGKLSDWAWKCSESLTWPLKGCDFAKKVCLAASFVIELENVQNHSQSLLWVMIFQNFLPSGKLSDWAWKCSESLSEPLKGCDFPKKSLPNGSLCDWAWKWSDSLSEPIWVMIFQNFLPSGKLSDRAWKCSESLSGPLTGCDFPKIVCLAVFLKWKNVWLFKSLFGNNRRGADRFRTRSQRCYVPMLLL